ncbi:hypothetical protein [Streptomyces sp. NPDC052107]
MRTVYLHHAPARRPACALDVVDDQHGQPTWSYALAQQLIKLGQAVAG